MISPFAQPERSLLIVKVCVAMSWMYSIFFALPQLYYFIGEDGVPMHDDPMRNITQCIDRITVGLLRRLCMRMIPGTVTPLEQGAPGNSYTPNGQKKPPASQKPTGVAETRGDFVFRYTP